MSSWKMVNISAKQIELIEKLIKNPKLAKYDFRSIPDFIRRAIVDKIKELEKEIE